MTSNEALSLFEDKSMSDGAIERRKGLAVKLLRTVTNSEKILSDLKTSALQFDEDYSYFEIPTALVEDEQKKRKQKSVSVVEEEAIDVDGVASEGVL